MKTKAIIGLFIFVTIAFGQYGRGAGMGWMNLTWNEDLNLTNEQITEIDGLSADFQKGRIDSEAEIRKLQLDLQQQMKAENPDQKVIDVTLEKIHDQKLNLDKQRTRHHQKVRALLTPEQCVIFDQQTKSFGSGKGKRGGRKGHGGRRGNCDGSGPNGRGGGRW